MLPRALFLSLLTASSAIAADAGAGALDERALQFHEACFEARLSLDRAGFEREWSALAEYLKTSLTGKAGVVITGGPDDWRLHLTPSSGPMVVSATPAGVQLRTREGQEASRTRSLMSVYPLRRHYGCDGKRLAPKTPGIAAREQPCAPLPQSQAEVVKISASSQDGAILFPVAHLPCCYQVISSDGILEPGQILVEQPQHRYKLSPAPEDKMRMLYRENPSLFVMDSKRPKLYSLEFK